MKRRLRCYRLTTFYVAVIATILLAIQIRDLVS